MTKKEMREEIAACHAMLHEAITYVDPDYGDGQEFQDKLKAFLEGRQIPPKPSGILITRPPIEGETITFDGQTFGFVKLARPPFD